MKVLRAILKILPTLLIALILAIVVWVSAVTSSDPNEEITFAQPIPLNILGLDPDLTISGGVVDYVNVSIRAPRSIHARLANEPELIRASINLSGLEAGEHTLEPEVSISIGPSDVTRISPDSVTVKLENLSRKELPVDLQLTGSLPISYEAGEPKLSIDTAQINGAENQVSKITQVVAIVDLTNASTSISRTVELKPLDSRGVLVSAVTLTPSQITIEIPIKQLGGYRNVFVKIATTGQVASGFYLTGIVANPPTMTIYSNDPILAANLPAYIETVPVNLSGADESFSVNVFLNLPEGVEVIGEQNVSVQVSLAATTGAIQLLNIPINTINVMAGLKATLSPQQVDLYISGPLYLLENITAANVTATLDLANKTAGTYQIIPEISLDNPELQLDSILPGFIEVILAR